MIPVFGHAPTRPRPVGFRTVLTAWLAVLGLVVQITAAGACAMGAQSESGLDQGPFPICHAQRSADDGATQHHAPIPSHHDGCPFCATCCHAAIAVPQVFGVPARVAVVATEPQRMSRLLSLEMRCHGGASPRGPPRRV